MEEEHKDRFILKAPYKPTGDQPEAIAQLTDGLLKGDKCQTLLGVTGSGKTFTMANVIANLNRPTLVLAHNKTLAAQLCTEFKEFFPDNAVEYFVSYYDYYQPEAYIPSTDTYIEKDMSRDELMHRLVALQYERNDLNFVRNKFRVRGDIVEINLAYMNDVAIRIEFFGDEVDRISEVNALTGERHAVIRHIAIFPASHYIVSGDKMRAGLANIRDELDRQVKAFTGEGKLLEAQRIAQRTNYDIEMLTEVGTCKGIENYSAVLSGRAPGSTPTTLLDYFPEDFLLFVDESHVMLPQLRAMYGGDYARKKSLVDFGFRLPSAFDNRPLKFEEFESKLNQTVFVSATPGDFERAQSTQIVEQVIRPTGLLDPRVIVKPVEGQIEDLLGEINTRSGRGERVLVTTLTKKMAEDLTDYLSDHGVKVKYMHHEVDTFERVELMRDLRKGTIDVIVGINLLREGLDLPEVSLVAILDADKEGFLRSETSLVQTIGRAARNADGVVIMYADSITPSMERAIMETERRRGIQEAYNAANGITPKTIVKEISGMGVLEISSKDDSADKPAKRMSRAEIEQKINQLTREMREAAKILEFEHAAFLRDRIEKLRKQAERKTKL